MEFTLKICFYEKEIGALSKNVNFENLSSLNFNSVYLNGTTEDLLRQVSKIKFDIVVVNANGLDCERFSYILDLVYNNFCKNILLVSNFESYENNNVGYLSLGDLKNFDLKLEMCLMNIKRKIELSPSRNLPILKSKICGMLDEFQFSSRHDGFKYYVDCVLLAYMKQPYDYSTMNLYKEVGDKYGKSYYAVEKSMRMALIYAFNKLKSAPHTEEYDKLRSHLTYDLNNNTCISMILNMLINDKEIKEDLIEHKQFLYRR